MGKKALFFDIDGTLWDRYNTVPESTKTAIRKLKENGHLVFINSGRALGFIFHPNLMNLEFDGIVSGCGTIIEYHKELIFYKKMDLDTLYWSLNICKEAEFGVILEGKDYLYMNKNYFPDSIYADKLKRELGDRLKDIYEYEGKWEASKYSIACNTPKRDEAFEKLSERFSVIIHNPAVAEVVPIGYDKGTGIKKVCELLNIDIRDTYAFGDSTNDLEMLKVAGNSICMGDGYDIAKEASDYVTTDMMDDGIMNACLHYNLI